MMSNTSPRLLSRLVKSHLCSTRGFAPKTIAVIGCGVIGASWSALFLHHGHIVKAFDPRFEELREHLHDFFLRCDSTLPGVCNVARDNLHLCESISEAVQGADLVQENGPESLEFKQSLARELDDVCARETIIATSTSSLLVDDIVESAVNYPERFILAHPFNPPHIIPLVELYGRCPTVVSTARDFYNGVGRSPIIMQKQLPGHVANRLTAAVFREAVHMVQEGVATVKDIDTAMVDGPGLRYGLMGPFMTYHLAGGAGGIEHYLKHLGPSQERRWQTLGQAPELSQPYLHDKIVEGVADMLQEHTSNESQGNRLVVEDNLQVSALASLRDSQLNCFLDCRQKNKNNAEPK